MTARVDCSVSTLTALGSKEAGCEVSVATYTRQQTIAMLDRDTGDIVERTLEHDGTAVRLRPPVIVGIEATGSMGWFCG